MYQKHATSLLMVHKTPPEMVDKTQESCADPWTCEPKAIQTGMDLHGLQNTKKKTLNQTLSESTVTKALPRKSSIFPCIFMCTDAYCLNDE